MKLKCLVFLLCALFVASVFPPAMSAEAEFFMKAKLLDVSGTEIEQNNLEQARSVVVDIEKGEPAMEAELIAAAYNAEGNLLDVLAKKISMPVGASYYHTFDINPPANSAERLTVFLWDNRENCTPLAKRFSFYKTRFSATQEDAFYIDRTQGGNVSEGADSVIRQFPYLYAFDNTVIVTYSQHTDSHVLHPYDAMMISFDGGRTWGEKKIDQDLMLTSMVKRSNGQLYGIGYISYYVDNETIEIYYWTSEDGGKTWEKNTGNISFAGAPDTVKPGSAEGKWGSFLNYRGMIELPDGSLITTMYGRFTNDTQYRSIVIKSEDGGQSWHYLSTIASGSPVAGDGTVLSQVQGFCEPVMERCADGSVLAVMRVSSGDQSLYQARSMDNGFTWSTPEPLPGIQDQSKVYSVDPDLRLMSDGTLALSYGRPNEKLIFSLDGCGYQWSEDTMLTTRVGGSGYTGVREVAPSRLLVAGDIGASDVLAGNYGIWGRFIHVLHRTSTERVPASALLTADQKTMKNGENAQLTLTVFDQDGRLFDMADGQIVWNDANGVTEIDESGALKATANGEAKLSATFTKDEKSVVSNELVINIGDLEQLFSISALAEEATIDVGKTTQMIITPRNYLGQGIHFNGIDISYDSSAPEIATVDADGTVTGKALGSAAIKVTAVQGNITAETEVEVEVCSRETVATSSFEDEITGEAPLKNGFSINMTKQTVFVTEEKANTGSKSVHLKDTVTNGMPALRVNDAQASATRTISFSVFPVNLTPSLCITFYPDNTYTSTKAAFNLSLNSAGAIRYHNGVWNELLPEGTIKIGEWNQVQIATNTLDKSIAVTANGKTAVAGNTKTTVIPNTMGVEIRSGASGQTGCEAFLDDVTVLRTNATLEGGRNLLKNPGFESGTESWISSGGTLESITEEHCSGKLGVQVHKSAKHGYVGQKVAVTPGSTYFASAWVKLGSDGPARRVNLCGTYKDQSGKDVYVEMVKPTIEPGEWTKLSGSITIPDNVKEITLYVQSWGADGDASLLAQGFFVDNVKFALAQ